VEQASSSVVLIVGVPEPELLQHALGCRVLRVVTRKQRAGDEVIERQADDRAGSLGGEPFPPESGAKMESKFEDSVLQIARMKASASGKFFRPDQEHGPILNAVALTEVDLLTEPLFDGASAECFAGIDEHGNTWVTP
jgi:hypothetical protein